MRTATEDERHDDARRANATTARPGGTPMFVPIAGRAGRLFAGAARTVTPAAPDGGGVFRRRDARRGRLPGLGERGGVDAAGRNASPAPGRTPRQACLLGPSADRCRDARCQLGGRPSRSASCQLRRGRRDRRGGPDDGEVLWMSAPGRAANAVRPQRHHCDPDPSSRAARRGSPGGPSSTLPAARRPAADLWERSPRPRRGVPGLLPPGLPSVGSPW
jgi:hypothetical protein